MTTAVDNIATTHPEHVTLRATEAKVFHDNELTRVSPALLQLQHAYEPCDHYNHPCAFATIQNANRATAAQGALVAMFFMKIILVSPFPVPFFRAL